MLDNCASSSIPTSLPCKEQLAKAETSGLPCRLGRPSLRTMQGKTFAQRRISTLLGWLDTHGRACGVRGTAVNEPGPYRNHDQRF